MLKRWAPRVLLVAGIALLVWLISRFPLADIGTACLDLGGWVFICPIIAMGWFAAASCALGELLGGSVPFRALFWNRLVGEGYNALIPAAGIGGEPFKLRMLSRYIDTHRAVVGLINDRLIDNGASLAMSAVCVGIGAWQLDMSASLRDTMIAYAIGAGVATVAIALVLMTNLTSRLGGRIAKWIGSATNGHERLPARVLARAFAWTMLARAVGLLEIWLLFALLGLDYTFGDILFMSGALQAAGFVGGVVPQGIGVAEAATVGIFEMMHFPGAAAVAFALARRGRQLVTSVGGVALHLVFERVASRKLALAEVDDHVRAAPQPAE
jgi:hypothetical protein